MEIKLKSQIQGKLYPTTQEFELLRQKNSFLSESSLADFTHMCDHLKNAPEKIVEYPELDAYGILEVADILGFERFEFLKLAKPVLSKEGLMGYIDAFAAGNDDLSGEDDFYQSEDDSYEEAQELYSRTN